MEEIPEVRLHIENHTFTVKKDLLCEHSDYFRAMFSGNYVENDQQDISIDVDAVDANSMNIILRYIDLGLIDLWEYELPVIGCLATAANFLQITELTKQIEYCIDIQLSPSNWVETMTIAQNAAYKNLEQAAVTYGLLSFKAMNINCIPSIRILFWYLSHPYLDTRSEIEVFKFGLEWVIHNKTGVDALLIILGCLDMKRVLPEEFEDISNLLQQNFPNSLAAKVLECLLKECQDLSVSIVISQKDCLCKLFSEEVYDEVLNLLVGSKERKLAYTPVVPVWMMKDSKMDYTPHFMYTYSKEQGFEKWLEVADKNLWGWSVVSWGSSKLIIVGGEHGRGTGCFMRDVKVYDTLRKEWINHGVELPQRRHGGVALLGDTLFCIGGVGGFRVTLDTAVTYDLKQRSFRKVAQIPNAIQSPAICTHKGSIYAAVGHKSIYQYVDMSENNYWTEAVETDMRHNKMTSYKDHIYCSQNYFSAMYRFRPGFDKKLEHITNFSNPPAAICNLYDRLIVFTRPMCTNADSISVEEFKDDANDTPNVIMSTSTCSFTINDVAGSCTVVTNIPPIQNDVSSYHEKYLSQYT